ncbi:hypothetical protein [Snuella lapsa]|uniref:Redoxin domain-containing protein n=1 Tax=Snuella lapsa TaxID=870481 RepID=A0ABP6WZK1_9FLAO
MKSNLIIKVIVICLFISSCVDHKKSQNVLVSETANFDDLKGNVIVFPENFLVNKYNKNLLLIYFDGNCSSCVAETLNWIKKINEVQNRIQDIQCFFVSRSNDVYLIEYYIDKLQVELQNNQYLKADPNDFFIKNNSFLDSYRNILLLDSKNRIITSLDPFKSELAMQIYVDKGVLSKKILN